MVFADERRTRAISGKLEMTPMPTSWVIPKWFVQVLQTRMETPFFESAVR